MGRRKERERAGKREVGRETEGERERERERAREREREESERKFPRFLGGFGAAFI